MKRARFIVAMAAAVAAPAACLSKDSSVPVFPNNANVYVFSLRAPPLVYSLVDTATGIRLHQTWLADRGLVGAICIGLVPHAAVTDTFGTFIFGYYDPAIGEVEETLNGTTDTVLKTLEVIPGRHGAYAVDTVSGRLTLAWTDGTPSQYFDPSADIRLIRDTITAHAELSAFADSEHVTWRMTLPRDICQP
ncbi:MAG: hypothetical protein ACHQX4_00785 [Gemmatimonadales bacterium]